MLESLSGADLMEDAVGMKSARWNATTSKVRVAKVPPILVEKHKVLQILVNVIRNASTPGIPAGRTNK